MKYVAYYRVSTQKQGRSGLGLDDQKAMVHNFIRGDEELIAEFIEIESGRKKERPQLQEAINIARKNKAQLLIAKLDRLSRNASFVMMLRDSKIDFIACDLPDANTLTIGIMASFAQYEAEQVSKRTKAALRQKKIRGFKLGKPENLTEKARKLGTATLIKNARENPANRQASELAQMYRKNKLTLREIVDKLNDHGFRTRKGNLFKPMSVSRLLERNSEINNINVKI